MKNLIRVLITVILTTGSTTLLWSQSQTTGTLNLRNTQPETIGLSIPGTGVTGYKLLLPPTVGGPGQAMTITAVAGGEAQLSWTDASNFWQLTGTAITTGGTAVGNQYLGTSNAQDLVLAANGDEAIRIIGVAGPNQGYIGLGTATPQAHLDVAGNLLLSNTGSASELRFGEPSASGTDYTSFRASAQTGNITYTLPPNAPPEDGMVLTSTAGGDMSWQKPLFKTPMGIYTPDFLAFQHVINVGVGALTPGSIPMVTMLNPPGTTIGISVTNRDPIAGTITVETSVPLGIADRIAWVIFNP